MHDIAVENTFLIKFIYMDLKDGSDKAFIKSVLLLILFIKEMTHL